MKRRTALSIIVLAAALMIAACGSVNVQVNPDTQPDVQADTQADGDTAVKDEVVQDTEVENNDIDYPTLPLPEYHYYGPEDWADYGDAVGQYLMECNYGDEDTKPDLVMCAPIVVKVDDSDPDDVKVWGDFEVRSYTLFKTSLLGAGGGSFPGGAHIVKGDTPVVSGIDYVEDGSGYDASFERLFGKAGLKDTYIKAVENRDDQIINALSYYIDHNGLYITQCQDYGWPPVSIPNAPETREEDEMCDFDGNYGYTAKYDIRQISSLVMEDVDVFGNVYSDDINDFLIEITSEKGSDINNVIAELRTHLFDPSVELKREDDVAFNGIDGCTRLSNEPPYSDGDKIYMIYLVPRDGEFLEIEVSSDYSSDEEKQMATDDIISAFLGSIELK